MNTSACLDNIVDGSVSESDFPDILHAKTYGCVFANVLTDGCRTCYALETKDID